MAIDPLGILGLHKAAYMGEPVVSIDRITMEYITASGRRVSAHEITVMQMNTAGTSTASQMLQQQQAYNAQMNAAQQQAVPMGIGVFGHSSVPLPAYPVSPPAPPSLFDKLVNALVPAWGGPQTVDMETYKTRKWFSEKVHVTMFHDQELKTDEVRVCVNTGKALVVLEDRLQNFPSDEVLTQMRLLME